MANRLFWRGEARFNDPLEFLAAGMQHLCAVQPYGSILILLYGTELPVCRQRGDFAIAGDTKLVHWSERRASAREDSHSTGRFMKKAKSLRMVVAGLATAAFVFGPAMSTAMAACSADGLQLIKNLNGNWRGSGTVKPIGGADERISCRVGYQGAGARVSQNITCAGTDYKIEASADVTCDDNKVSGVWSEKVANNTGRVKGQIDGERLSIDVEGANFQGRIAVKVSSAAKHSLTITQFDPGAGRHVPVATVSLSK